MAQDFGDDMGNALLNFVTRQTENYLRFGRGRERAFDWWQRHYKKEGNTPEAAKAMAEKQSSREQVVVPFGTSEEAAYYAQVCRENGTYAAAYTDKQGNGFLAFAKRRMQMANSANPEINKKIATSALGTLVIATVFFYLGDRYAETLVTYPGQIFDHLSDAFLSMWQTIKDAPFALDMTSNSLLFGGACFLIIWMIWLRYVAFIGNYRSGEESGSARWGTVKEGKKFKDLQTEDNNLLFTKNFGLALHRPKFDPEYDRNLNVLVVGGSGSGKTFNYVTPNICQLNTSYFVTDPKGTLLKDAGYLFTDNGYKLKSFNTINLDESMHYNPLKYVKTDTDILSFVNCFIMNTNPEGKSSGDPFWENAEKMLYTALIALLRDWFPAKDYHFYYADEPKPPNSHFKRAVYCEDLDTVFTSLETCADAIGFNGSISDLADKVANGTVVKGHRLGFVGVDRKPLPNGDKWKPAVTDAKRENMQVGRVSSPLYGKQSVKPARLQEWLGTICEYENAVSKPATERITGIRPDGAIFLRRQIAATELLSLADRYGEYLDFADEAADFAPFLYDASFSTRGAYLKVSSPGNIYREAGFPQDPFFYTYNHLRDALVPKGFYPSTVRVRHPHGLTLEQIKRLPELLERPVVLMDSDRDDTMIAVLADVDEDGFPLIAALRPGGNAVSEGRSVGGTIVCSFYGKPENYFRFKMQQMPQRVLYQDIEKGRELDARAKLQLFGGNIASPDLDRRIIRPPECIVKLRADTPQMETHGRETSRVRRESRDMASGRAALDAGRRAETARVTERHIDSNLK